MKIETDLDLIRKVAQKKENENYEFRSFLKMLATEDWVIDQWVQKIAYHVENEIDCTKCAQCCKGLVIEVKEKDVKNLARGMKIKSKLIKEQYLVKDEEQRNCYNFKAQPCPLLKDNKCSVYDYRPKTCADYPFLHKEGFRSRLLGVIANYGVCPIVYNVLEQLKVELWTAFKDGEFSEPEYDEDEF